MTSGSAILTGVLISLPCSAAEGLENESLRAISSFYVNINLGSDSTGIGGLSAEQIQTDVELRLRKGGIKIISSERSVQYGPFLYVAANLMRRKDSPSFVYNISVRFVQLVKTARDVVLLAPTWTSGDIVGIVGINYVNTDVRETIGDLVDHFLNDYLSVNPK